MRFIPDKPAADSLSRYSLKRVDSFNCRINHIIGGNSFGKSWALKCALFSRFVERGETFAWCRSTKEMLKLINNSDQFFGRMSAVLPSLGVHSYKVHANKIYINDKLAGYLLAIDTFFNQKGADYIVHTAVWDEFMRENGELYRGNRRERFYKLIEAIGRDEVRKIYLISNSTNQFDDVLAPYGVNLSRYGIYLDRSTNSLIHYVRPSKEHIQRMTGHASYLGKTEIERDVSVYNKFINHGAYAAPAKATYCFTIQHGDADFISVYGYKDGYYIMAGVPAANRTVLTNDRRFVNSTVRLLPFDARKALAAGYAGGGCVFKDGYARDSFINLSL